MKERKFNANRSEVYKRQRSIWKAENNEETL